MAKLGAKVNMLVGGGCSGCMVMSISRVIGNMVKCAEREGKGDAIDDEVIALREALVILVRAWAPELQGMLAEPTIQDAVAMECADAACGLEAPGGQQGPGPGLECGLSARGDCDGLLGISPEGIMPHHGLAV